MLKKFLSASLVCGLHLTFRSIMPFTFGNSISNKIVIGRIHGMHVTKKLTANNNWLKFELTGTKAPI